MATPLVKPKRFISLDLDSTLIYSLMTMPGYYDLFNLVKNGNATKTGVMVELCTTNCDLISRIYQFILRDIGVTPGTGTVTPMWGIFRPHLMNEFSSFMQSYFNNIFVWSAGQTTYVDAIVDKIFTGDLQPKIVYSYPDCVIRGDYIFKDLSKLVEDPVAKEVGADLTNTFALDDRLDTFSNNPQNGIQIPEYKSEETADSIKEDDIALLQLKEWLTLPEVEYAPDIRDIKNLRISKDKIFQTSLDQYHAIKTGIPITMKSGNSNSTLGKASHQQYRLQNLHA
jgi:TFIIF-interacting CTD phosphatase-like protein